MFYSQHSSQGVRKARAGFMNGSLKAFSKLAPVALFVYNRPEHTRRTVQSLKHNYLAAETELFIFADGAKGESSDAAVQEVRKYLRTIEGFSSVTIVERERNLGLANSVINGVTQLCNQFGRVIAVEDDLLTSSDFLNFMNNALDRYKSDAGVFSVTGFNFPIEPPKDYPYDAFCTFRSSSWGWGTWKDRWQKADWSIQDFPEFIADREKRKRFNRGGDDLTGMLELQVAGRLNSWSIRWDYAHYEHDAVALYSVASRVYNIGFDGSGVHCKHESMNQTALASVYATQYQFPINTEAHSHFTAEIYKLHRVSPLRKVAHYLKMRFETQ
jgi:hypothetical protein